MNMCNPFPGLIALAVLAGCSGRPTTTPATLAPPPSSRYLLLEAGTTLVFHGELDGADWQETVVVLDATRTLAGFLCRGVHEQITVGGAPLERTTEWLAVDAQGNLWKCGEETEVASGDVWVRGADSWLADADKVAAWVALPAQVQPGDQYFGAHPGGMEVYQVAATDDTFAVPAGLFQHCLTVVENPDDPEDTDIILYAPGVGRVAERNAHGHLELVEIRR